MHDANTDQIEQAAEKLGHKAAAMEPIDGRILLDCGERKILIDGSGERMSVSVVSEADADCEVRIRPQMLTEILEGQRDAFMEFTTGKIGIKGDMSIAVKLQPMLSEE